MLDGDDRGTCAFYSTSILSRSCDSQIDWKTATKDLTDDAFCGSIVYGDDGKPNQLEWIGVCKSGVCTACDYPYNPRTDDFDVTCKDSRKCVNGIVTDGFNYWPFIFYDPSYLFSFLGFPLLILIAVIVTADLTIKVLQLSYRGYLYFTGAPTGPRSGGNSGAEILTEPLMSDANL